jgi:hypothetical protein
MSAQPPLVFKFASEDWELEEIHWLNYKTFVQEIPQHQASPSHRLVDKFHSENTYLICLCARKLAGMLAVRGIRPFSLDLKLANLDAYLPPGRKICEIRLLAVEKKFRGAQVLQGILALLWQHGIEKGYDLAIISGTTRQFKLYHHLGFVPFGPIVGSGEAQFQPMYVTLDTFEHTARKFLRSSSSRSFQPSTVSFLPGPVAVPREVRRAFEQAAEPHRAEAFVRDSQTTRQLLCELVRAGKVELLLDLDLLKSLGREFQAKLCLDAISSIGTLPPDMRDSSVNSFSALQWPCRRTPNALALRPPKRRFC